MTQERGCDVTARFNTLGTARAFGSALAEAATAVAGPGTVERRRTPEARIVAPATVVFLNAAAHAPPVDANLRLLRGHVRLAQELEAGEAAAEVLAAPGFATLEVLGRGRALRLAKTVRLHPGRSYCLAMVTLPRGHGVIVEDVTKRLAYSDLAHVCRRVLRRWER